MQVLFCCFWQKKSLLLSVKLLSWQHFVRDINAQSYWWIRWGGFSFCYQCHDAWVELGAIVRMYIIIEIWYVCFIPLLEPRIYQEVSGRRLRRQLSVPTLMCSLLYCKGIVELWEHALSKTHCVFIPWNWNIKYFPLLLTSHSQIECI